MSETLAVVTRAQLLHRIKAEYMEMPGLRLTAPQAGRLWGLDSAACLDLLERLLAERFLQQRPDGTYARVTDGIPAALPHRRAKAPPGSESRLPETRHAAALARGLKGFLAGARLAMGTTTEE